MIELPIDPRAAEEGVPPPRGMYAIFDRPLNEDKNVNADALALATARVALYGKQTDREARLEVAVNRWNLESVRLLLSTLLPTSLGTPDEPEVTHRQSVTSELFHAELQMPEGLSAERSRERRARSCDSTCSRPGRPSNSLVWEAKLPPKQPATPVSADRWPQPCCCSRLEAENARAELDFNELRQKLGLPPAGPIDPHGLEIEQLPLARLRRIDVAQLNDEQLTAALDRAATFELRGLVAKIGKQMLTRAPLMERLGADRIYMMLAGAANDAAEAMRYLGEGRAAAVAANRSTARSTFRN